MTKKFTTGMRLLRIDTSDPDNGPFGRLTTKTLYYIRKRSAKQICIHEIPFFHGNTDEAMQRIDDTVAAYLKQEDSFQGTDTRPKRYKIRTDTMGYEYFDIGKGRGTKRTHLNSPDTTVLHYSIRPSAHT